MDSFKHFVRDSNSQHWCPQHRVCLYLFVEKMSINEWQASRTEPKQKKTKNGIENEVDSIKNENADAWNFGWLTCILCIYHPVPHPNTINQRPRNRIPFAWLHIRCRTTQKNCSFWTKKKNIDRNNDFLVWFHSKLSSWKWFNCSTDKWCKIQGRSTISINPLKCGSVCSTAKVRGNSILFYFLGDARKWLRLRRLETTSLETHLSPSRVAIQ